MEEIKDKLLEKLNEPETAESIPPEQVPQETPTEPEQPPQINPLQLAQAAINAMQQENAQLRQQIQESQKSNEETVMQNLSATPLPLAPIFPQFDYDNSSDEDRQTILNKYSQDMANFMGGVAEQKMKPFETYYQQQTRQAEENNIVNGIIRSGQLPDFQEKLPEIRQLLANVPDLQKLPPQAQYSTAYYMLKGYEAANAKPAEDTVESLLAKVKANPDVIKAIKAEEIAAVKQNGEVPPHVASGGAANIAATLPPKRPERLEDVKTHIGNKF